MWIWVQRREKDGRECETRARKASDVFLKRDVKEESRSRKSVRK
jgi:hypothetical protein